MEVKENLLRLLKSNETEFYMKNIVFRDIKPSSYRTGNMLRLRYKTKPVNAM
jgi:hypothetical protein